MHHWPLTARRGQIQELADWYADPGVGGCLITGPAGVGKTRLAEETLRQAADSGRPTGRALGHPATRAIPLGALAHLLPVGIGDVGLGPDGRAALFHAARAALAASTGEQRLLLVVDDVDQVDDLSLALLLPLVLQQKVFVVATMRTGRELPGPVATLVADGLLARMELGSLTDAEVATLLHRVLDGPLEPVGLARFQHLAAGNLQLLRELLRSARDQGVLRRGDDSWQLTGSIDTAALEDLVLGRVGRLDEPDRRALELVAVAGRLGLADLEALCGAEVLDRLDQRELIAVRRLDRRVEVSLAHPLYGEALAGRLSVLRQRALHRDLADRLAVHGARRREDALRLALWRLDAGGDLDPTLLVRAGRLALVARDQALALRFARALASQGHPAAATMEVEAHLLTGQVEAALTAIAEAWDGPAPPGDVEIEHLARRGADLRFALSDLDGALALNQAGQDRIATPVLRASLQAHRAALLATAAHPIRALAEAEGSQAAAPADPRLRIEVSIARSVAFTCLGRFDEAAEAARAGMAAQQELPSWLVNRGMATQLVNEAHALAYAGHYGQARDVMLAARDRAEVAQAPGAALWFELVLAEIARDTGRADEAVRRFGVVAGQARCAGWPALQVWADVGVAQGHLLAGRIDEGRAALAAADAAGHSPVATSDHTRERTRAWLLAAEGDLPAARELLGRTADQMADAEVFAFEASLRHDLVRFGDPARSWARLDELAGMVTGPLVQGFALHARAAAERDPVGLGAALDLFDRIDSALLAAEVAAELADLRRRAGDQRAAAAATHRLGGLVDRCGEVRTPPLALALAAGSAVEPLTAREREVALLAAAGLPSRQIAEQLYVSKRTVDTHLDRIYRKLGVSGRSGLAAVLGPAERA